MEEEQKLEAGTLEPGGPVQPPPVPRRRRSWRWLAVPGVVLLVAVSVVTALRINDQLRPQPAAQMATAQPQPPPRPEPAPAERDLRVDNEVNGAEGRTVVVGQGGRVMGTLKARVRASIGGSVTGDVEAPVVEVGELNGYGSPIVYGSVRADTALIGKRGQVLGPVVGKQLLEIAGTVTGNIEAPRIILRAGAVINGDVTTSGGRLVLEPGAVVNGALKGGEAGLTLQMPGSASEPGRPYPPPYSPPAAAPATTVIYRTPPLLEYGLMAVGGILGLMAMTALCRVFLPTHVDELAAALERRPWRSLLTGIWTLLLAGLAGFVLAVIIIGIPLTVALALVASALLIVGITGVSDLAGRRLLAALKREGAVPLQGTAAGALSLGLLLCVPILGWLLVALATIASFGAGVGIWYPRVRTAWQNRRRQPAAG